MFKYPLEVLLLVAILPFTVHSVFAQSAPSRTDIANYTGLHLAAHEGDLDRLVELLNNESDIEVRDGSGRTPLHVAAFASHDAIVERLAIAGADLDVLDSMAYDIVTIAAVANDIKLLDLALELGASASNITSPYDGTALIAAAHLGHAAVVERLIKSDAPLDHVNNLGWTALIEAVILGDGGTDHVATVAALLGAGANAELADRQGITPVNHAQERGYDNMLKLLEEH